MRKTPQEPEPEPLPQAVPSESDSAEGLGRIWRSVRKMAVARRDGRAPWSWKVARQGGLLGDFGNDATLTECLALWTPAGSQEMSLTSLTLLVGCWNRVLGMQCFGHPQVQYQVSVLWASGQSSVEPSLQHLVKPVPPGHAFEG